MSFLGSSGTPAQFDFVDLSGALNMASSSNIQDAGVDVIQLDGTQTVAIPNGNIDISGNAIQSGTTNTLLSFGNTGGLFLDVGDGSGNSIDALNFQTAGPHVINIPNNSHLSVTSESTTGDNLSINATGEVEVGNGNLDISNDLVGDNGRLNFTGNNAIFSADTAGTGFIFQDANAISLLQLNEGGPVEFPNTGVNIQGGLTMSGQIDMQFSQSVINLPDPINPRDAANKQFVEGVAQGLDLKESVEAATDGTSIDLTSTVDPNPIDGVTLLDGERVLLKDQADGTENGIYSAVTATDPSTWVRSQDANEDAEVTTGLFTFVRDGTANGSTSFVISTSDPITLGTTSITFSQFASAGAIQAGIGLLKTGQLIDLDVPAVSGTGIEASADTFRISSTAAGSGISGGSGSALSLTNDTVTIAGNSVSLGGSVEVDLADLATFDLAANSLVDGANTVYDAAAQQVPLSIFEATDVTINSGTGLTGGGSATLGGAGLNLSLTNTDISINTTNGLTGGTVSLGGAISVGIAGSLELDSDLRSNSTLSNQLIYDESLGEVVTDVLPDPLSVNRLNANIIGDSGAGSLNIFISGTRRANINNSGDLSIEGELTEGAAL